MQDNNSSRIIETLSISFGIFFTAVVLPRLLIDGGTLKIATTQALELILSLGAILVVGRGDFIAYGFCRPARDPYGRIQWLVPVLVAPVVGAAASILTLACGGSGNPTAKQMTLPEIILFIWILSSTIEELFTRGFLQSHLGPMNGRRIHFLFWHIELPAFISAVFFAAMHLVLLFAGVDAVTMITVLLFTFTIGLLAGHTRAGTGSLYPAIGVHMLGNVGGMIGGILYSVYTVLSGGRLPGL
ncbi:MAG TPA: CPBP family intramembrane metalloprotease [candidate division Zixibacteria bacterium]|nr:CPBP family intramembrane metalloprotease [candidate division Zixibacteria bacterium]